MLKDPNFAPNRLTWHISCAAQSSVFVFFFLPTFPRSNLLISLHSLHHLITLSLAHNHSDPIPVWLNLLDRLTSLQLDSIAFSGSVPVTRALSCFNATSFTGKPELYWEIIHKPCDRHSRFFGPSHFTPSSSSAALLEQSKQGIVVVHSPVNKKMHKSYGLVLRFAVGVAFILGFTLTVIALARKKGGLGKVPEGAKTTTLGWIELARKLKKIV